MDEMDFMDCDDADEREGLRSPNCHCEEHERCQHCLPRPLLSPAGSDSPVLDVHLLYARSGSSCSCVTGEICRHCVPDFAPLLAVRIHDAYRAAGSSPLKTLTTPLEWLQTEAERN